MRTILFVAVLFAPVTAYAHDVCEAVGMSPTDLALIYGGLGALAGFAASAVWQKYK